MKLRVAPRKSCERALRSVKENIITTTPLFKKLNLGEHKKILVLNSPESFEAEIAQLEGIKVLRKASPKQKLTFVLGFAITQADCNQVSSAIVDAIEADAIVWIAYPKGTSKKYKCEFNRDTGWTFLGNAGLEPVRQVAIDEDWSALRFRKTEFIKTMTRSKKMAISEEGKRRVDS